jgi:predicted alpha/beta superfamily hydrolase
MIGRHRAAAALVLMLSIPTTAPSRSASRPAEIVRPVILPQSRRIDFVSSVNGRHYTLFVALPHSADPPPARGYPVIYVLDGNSLFGTAVDAARYFVKSGIVVVGIGYPLDDAKLVGATTKLPTGNSADLLRAAGAAGTLWRNHDLTLPASDEFIRNRPGFGITRENVGGVDDFLATIDRDVKPRIASIVKVDPGNQALYGHSFGGLAVVRALFTRPEAYRSFIAASPSVYWNDRAVLADEAAFVARVRDRRVAPRVMITVGGDESTPPTGASASEVAGFRLRRTVDNARELAARLAGVEGASAYSVRGVVFPDEGHVSVQQASISRGIRFAFDDWQVQGR